MLFNFYTFRGGEPASGNLRQSYDKEKVIHEFDFVNTIMSIHYGSVKYNKNPSHGCF